MTKAQHELLLVGRCLDIGCGSMPDDIWEAGLKEVKRLTRLVRLEKKYVSVLPQTIAESIEK